MAGEKEKGEAVKIVVMRRRRAWDDTRFAGATIAESATLKRDLLADLAASETKTVTRIIGTLQFYATPPNDVDYHNVLEIGIGVVSKEAFDLETLPDVNTETDYPQQGWLYVATRPAYQVAAGTLGIMRQDAIFSFDIRAQRKVDRGVLFMLIENTGISPGGSTMSIVGRVRALCLT